MPSTYHLYHTMRQTLTFIITFCLTCYASAQTIRIEDILTDIYSQLSEDGNIPMESLQEELMEIADNPINLNNTSADELSQLHFLSDEQIDAILVYQYKHPFRSIYELQLIPELRDYDIRNLLPFVVVQPPTTNTNKLYPREVFHYANHEITIRTDARNCENYTNDPFYAKLRYRFNYRNRVQAGLTFCRPTGTHIRNWQYGGFIQLQDIGHLRTLVAGDFQASFGQGLVVGTPFHIGKSSYLSSLTNQQEGVRKFSTTATGFNAFHGVGATARIRWADISTFYSLQRQTDSTWHHVLGANLTARYRHFKIGITLLENLYSASTSHAPSQQPQLVLGLNARYHINRIDLWGEIATSQGSQWGIASILGARLTPLRDFSLVALYRYYAPNYNNPYAYSFSEHSTLRDENGFYIGTEIKRLPYWRFAFYTDAFREGADVLLQTDYTPNDTYTMTWRIRAKHQEQKGTYSLRYYFIYNIPHWRFRTQAEANIVHLANNKDITYGISLFQDIEYQLSRIPLVLQWRLQGFDARQWNNRIYAYENDILYAYSFPNAYGLGLRTYINARYHINDMFSLYLRLSETVYQHQWAVAHDRASTQTDIHLLLRIHI